MLFYCSCLLQSLDSVWNIPVILCCQLATEVKESPPKINYETVGREEVTVQAVPCIVEVKNVRGYRSVLFKWHVSSDISVTWKWQVCILEVENERAVGQYFSSDKGDQWYFRHVEVTNLYRGREECTGLSVSTFQMTCELWSFHSLEVTNVSEWWSVHIVEVNVRARRSVLKK